MQEYDNCVSNGRAQEGLLNFSNDWLQVLMNVKRARGLILRPTVYTYGHHLGNYYRAGFLRWRALRINAVKPSDYRPEEH